LHEKPRSTSFPNAVLSSKHLPVALLDKPVGFLLIAGLALAAKLVEAVPSTAVAKAPTIMPARRKRIDESPYDEQGTPGTEVSAGGRCPV
jgi:hypothetical protein